MKDNSKFSDFTFLAIMFLMLFMLISYAYKFYSLYSLLLTVITILVVILFIITFKLSKRLLFDLLFLILIIISTGYVVLQSDIHSFDDLSSYIGLIMGLLFVYILSKTKLNIRGRKIIIFYLVVIISLVLGTLISSNYNRSGYLMYGFENQNSTGVYFLVFLISFDLVMTSKCNNKKILNLIVLLAGLILLYLIGSRTSLFSFIIYLIVRNISLRKKSLKFLIKLIIGIPFIIPLIYIITWVYLGESGITILGREIFTNRENLWINIFDNAQLLIRGNYSNLDNFLLTSQGSHNMYLSLMWGYGLFNFIIIVIFIYRAVSNILIRNFITERNVLVSKSVFALGVMFLHGSFEDVLFRNIWVTIMVFSLLIFSNNHKREFKNEK